MEAINRCILRQKNINPPQKEDLQKDYHRTDNDTEKTEQKLYMTEMKMLRWSLRHTHTPRPY